MQKAFAELLRIPQFKEPHITLSFDVGKNPEIMHLANISSKLSRIGLFPNNEDYKY